MVFVNYGSFLFISSNAAVNDVIGIDIPNTDSGVADMEGKVTVQDIWKLLLIFYII